MTPQKIELLAPGGDIDSIKAAVLAGANAIYCGLEKFNARARASNINLKNLEGIIRFAHKHDCEVFLTLNIIILEPELPALFKVLNRLVNTNVDGVIVQDYGVFHIINKYYPSLNVHVSTQATTHNVGQLKFLKHLGATRVNLSRELNIREITDLTADAHAHDIEVEVFVHGATCISFSGQCYISSVNGGNSGNRGRCSQTCRDEYKTTDQGKSYPFNVKDNSAFNDFLGLAHAGVDSIKIEGRIKKFDYVYTVVDTWNQQLQKYYANNELSTDDSALRKVFNRGLSNDFISGNIRADMFTENPRDNSLDFLKALQGKVPEEEITHQKNQHFDEKELLAKNVENKIGEFNIDFGSLEIYFSGQAGSPLQVRMQTPENEYHLQSRSNLISKGADSDAHALDQELFETRFKSLNDSEFQLDIVDVSRLDDSVLLPFKELTTLKKEMFKCLSGKDFIAPIDVPQLAPTPKSDIPKRFSILITDRDNTEDLVKTGADIYYKLPDSLGKKIPKYTKLFAKNPNFIPWFTSIMIGEDFDKAVELLKAVMPSKIVTNNTGLAFEASRLGIEWIAGPFMNIVNSYSLQCLQEEFNCVGAFLSNEISQKQLKNIRAPENFEVFYSIYHPIDLLTSRQCLFHQVTGCHKHLMDNTCISHCTKYAEVTNVNENGMMIEKLGGSYHRLYNDKNYLNTDIFTDLPDLFTNYLVDLRNVKTKTDVQLTPLEIFNALQDAFEGVEGSMDKLAENISPTTNVQYAKGL